MGTNNKARRLEKRRRQERARHARSDHAGDGSERHRSEPDHGAFRPSASADAGPGPVREPTQVTATPAQLVHEAVMTLHAGDPDGFARALERLDEFGAARPGGPHRGCEAVDGALVDRVSQLWPAGWQPVEVERHVRRELRGEIARDAAAIVVDAVTAEHATRQRSTPKLIVDARWTAQLDRMGARQWWSDSAGRLEQWGRRCGSTRIAALHVAIEALHQVSAMPRLPIWLPYPGAPSEVVARLASCTATPDTIDRKILDLVRALLAKAESTTFSDEADAFTAKAQQLMARHAIDTALLSVHRGEGGGRDVPGGRRVPVDDPYANAKATLVHCVAQANRSRAIFDKPLGLVTIMGFEGDLDIVELLVTSLRVQATAAMTAAGRWVDRSGTSRTRSFRQSFLMAYAIRVGERLQEANADTVAEATAAHGEALLPVLVGRSKAVQQLAEEVFPETKRMGSTAFNADGWTAGRLAAERASLGPGDNRRLASRAPS